MDCRGAKAPGQFGKIDEKMAALNELGVQTLLTKPYGADALLHALQKSLRKPWPRPAASAREAA